MINITKVAAVCNLGRNIDEIFNSACSGKNLPHKIDFELPKIEDKKYNLRCNQLLLELYNQIKIDVDNAIKKYGKDRVGVVVATTNSGIDEYEDTLNLDHLKISNPSEYLKDLLCLNSFYCCVSTACTSGVKAFSTAKKLLENNICDCVIVAGVDPIAKLPVAGFSALEVLTNTRTNPFSKNRCGMNIGEGAALFILEKDVDGIKLMGIGETSDAYNAATPDPEAKEAIRAIKIALKEANLKPEQIDYINLHGTGTIANDLMEARAVNEVFGTEVYCSSTKPLTGHCLGAAASIETALCIKILETGIMPPHIFDCEYDDELPKIKLVTDKNLKAEKMDVCMSNSFGFGGTNAILILGK
ncbi:MAG: hypothetical protein IJY61_09040 [Candidatus Gastranaerophilales bacterium]|nr:hypothetical protein [Candidatus Gastranaerophilales bacterium]